MTFAMSNGQEYNTADASIDEPPQQGETQSRPLQERTSQAGSHHESLFGERVEIGRVCHSSVNGEVATGSDRYRLNGRPMDTFTQIFERRILPHMLILMNELENYPYGIAILRVATDSGCTIEITTRTNLPPEHAQRVRDLVRRIQRTMGAEANVDVEFLVGGSLGRRS
jgi:hypothetical protein